MLKKITSALMAVTMAIGFAVSSAPEAQAGKYHNGVGLGIAAGIIGLGILGAASSAHARDRYYSSYDEPSCYRGQRECHWRGRRCFENRWGDVVCRGGRYICERPLICD